jgi:uncharacterized membrane protein YqaE (UPF0057 family)
MVFIFVLTNVIRVNIYFLMRYFLCILLPPLAVLSTGRVGAFILSILLTLLGWIPGMIFAILIVNKHYSDRKHNEMLQAVKQGKQY